MPNDKNENKFLPTTDLSEVDAELASMIKEVEGTDEGGREESWVEGKRPDIEGERKTEIGKIESAETIDRLLSGLTKILAGIRGKGEGIDLSKIESEGPNFEQILQRRLDTIKQKSLKYESRRKERSDRLARAKDQGFRVSIAKLRSMTDKNEKTKVKYTIENQNIANKIRESDRVIKTFDTLLANVQSEDIDIQEKALASLTAIVPDSELLTEIKEGKISPLVLRDVRDTLVSEKTLDQERRDFLGYLQTNNLKMSTSQENQIGMLKNTKPSKLDYDIPYGVAVYKPSYLDIRKELIDEYKKALNSEEMQYEGDDKNFVDKASYMLRSVIGLDTGEDSAKAAARLKQFRKDPKLFRKKLIEERGRAAITIENYVSGIMKGKTYPGYKVGIKGLGEGLKRKR